MGGRSGTIHTPDKLLDTVLGNPLEPGRETLGPNPEQLFAAAYAACYHSALIGAAKRLGTPATDSTVRAVVRLMEDEHGGFLLAVTLHAHLPGLTREQAQTAMDDAHHTCPYSKALRGKTAVTLVVD